VFLVARKNTLTGNTPEQLKGKTIGVEQGSAQETYVNQHWRPRGLISWPIRALIAWCGIWSPGVLMARCSPGMMADYSFLQQPQGKDFAFVGGHLQDDKLFGAGAAIGLRKDDDALRQEINRAIAQILADGTYKKLSVNILALTSIPGHNVVMRPAGTDSPPQDSFSDSPLMVLSRPLRPGEGCRI
jgi:lysine/arginine/ornithine transport system substrate-binding protein